MVLIYTDPEGLFIGKLWAWWKCQSKGRKWKEDCEKDILDCNDCIPGTFDHVDCKKERKKAIKQCMDGAKDFMKACMDAAMKPPSPGRL